MASDLTVLALVNEANDPIKPLAPTNVTMAAPQVSTGVRNTQIEITGRQGRGYVGAVTIDYDRLNLSELGEDIEIYSQELLSQEALLRTLNNRFGVTIDLTDVEPFNAVSPTPGGGEVPVVLTARSTSPVWIGETIVSVSFGKPQLVTVIADRTVPEFTFPEDQRTRKSARLMIYTLDWTSLQDALQVVAGTYANWEALQNTCVKLGIPGWTPGPIQDYATADLPGADQRYERVVVQSDVSAPNLVGDLYFHYNRFGEV